MAALTPSTSTNTSLPTSQYTVLSRARALPCLTPKTFALAPWRNVDPAAPSFENPVSGDPCVSCASLSPLDVDGPCVLRRRLHSSHCHFAAAAAATSRTHPPSSCFLPVVPSAPSTGNVSGGLCAAGRCCRGPGAECWHRSRVAGMRAQVVCLHGRAGPGLTGACYSNRTRIRRMATTCEFFLAT